VIINDGSTDSTESIVREYINRGYPIIYHYQENKGLGLSRNEALQLSNCEYIAFIDHDDTWSADKLEKQMALFDADPSVGLVYSDCLMLYQDGTRVLRSKFSTLRRGMIFGYLLTDEDFVVLSTAVTKKDILLECGGFMNYTIAEDFDMFLKITHKYPTDFVSSPLITYRYHQQNESRNIDLSYKEVVEILDYWYQQGNEEVKRMCQKSLARNIYGFSRHALFHLRDKAKAQQYVNESLQHKISLDALLLKALCFCPFWVIMSVRTSLLRIKSLR
jgi:glycosyltransferase involved in cell wall biosynthesis